MPCGTTAAGRAPPAAGARPPAPRARAWGGGGRRATGRDAVSWAREAAELGAGELLVTSIDSDGTHRGYDLELLRAICGSVRVPVIASGGAGQPADITAALETGRPAAVAAWTFHGGTYPFHQVKREVAACGLPIRI